MENQESVGEVSLSETPWPLRTRSLMSERPSFAINQAPAERSADKAELVELQHQKNLAWAAFYSAPLACDRPPSWKDQVECGNQCIRARGRFEQQWAATHPTEQTPGPVVLDNTAIKQLRSGPQSRQPNQ